MFWLDNGMFNEYDYKQFKIEPETEKVIKTHVDREEIALGWKHFRMMT